MPMAVSHRFVVVSGIPGSGKSTVGRGLAEHLNTPYLDKDDILESFFAELECSNEETRNLLSRKADQVFQTKALKCSIAVLDSFWRHPKADSQSGTPSGWLAAPGVCAVEVLCKCPAKLAADRFLQRKRHIGHIDYKWNHASLVAQSRELMQELPLGVGALIEIDTTKSIELKQLAVQVRVSLGS